MTGEASQKAKTVVTGGVTMKVRRVAQDRDNVVIEARREEAEAAALAAPSANDDMVGGDVFDQVIQPEEDSRD